MSKIITKSLYSQWNEMVCGMHQTWVELEFYKWGSQ